MAYRFALTAIVTGSFSLGEAALRFVLVAVGGAAVGLLVGRTGIFIVKRLKDSPAETTLTLVTSFAAYILAEHLGLSGVISTVVAGLYYGRKIPTVTSAQTRIAAEASWSTVLFIINGLVFTLIGLQMPAVMAGLEGYSWPATRILWRNHRARCDCRSIHLGVPCDLPSEEAVSFYCAQRSLATLGRRDGTELGRHERYCFARRRAIHSPDLAVGRGVPFQESAHLSDVRCDPGHALDSRHHIALAYAVARHQRWRREPPR